MYVLGAVNTGSGTVNPSLRVEAENAIGVQTIALAGATGAGLSVTSAGNLAEVRILATGIHGVDA